YLLRNDQHVHRRLRADIVKRQALVVFVGDLRGDRLVDDLEKDVVAEHGHGVAPSGWQYEVTIASWEEASSHGAEREHVGRGNRRGGLRAEPRPAGAGRGGAVSARRRSR